MLATVAALLLVCSPATAQIEVTHPSFLEAAVFVMTGRDGSPNDPAPKLVHEDDGDISVGANRYSIIPDQPTKIKVMRGDNGTMETFDFNNFSGPNAANLRSSTDGYGAAVIKIAIINGLGGYCKGPVNGAAPGEQVHMICYDGTVQVFASYISTSRRLQALQYIRNNYAPGLPQPPIVVKPY